MKHFLALFIYISVAIFHTNTQANSQSSLALFNLTPVSMDAIGADADLLFSLETELDKSSQISVMSRRDMEAILYRIGGAQVSDTKLVVSYGLELGVNFILAGEIDKIGSSVKVTVNLIDISNSRISQSWTESYIGRGDILQKSKLLARKVETSIINAVTQGFSSPISNSSSDYFLDITAKSIGSAIKLDWKLSPDISVLYANVYRGHSKEGPYEFVASVEETQFEDEVSGSYYYRLDLVLEDGREVTGNRIVNATSMSNKIKHDINLLPPTIMEFSSLVNGIKIDFIPQLNNQGVVGYNFYQKMKDNSWSKVHTIYKDKTLNYSVILDKNFEPDSQYQITISAYHSNGESQKSELLTFKTIALSELQSNDTALLRRAELSWTKVNSGSGYKIYRKSNSEDNWQFIKNISDITNTKFTDTESLEDGKSYIYSISVVDKYTETLKSKEVRVVTKPTADAVKSFLVESNLVKKVKLTWEIINDTDISGYAIYRHIGDITNETNLTQIAFIKGYETNHFIDGTEKPLEDGQQYHYAIAGRNLFEADGKLTLTQSANTKPLPTPPSDLNLSIEEGIISVNWRKSPETDIKHYSLFRKWNDEAWLKVANIEGTTYSDSDLKVYANTFYKINAIDNDDLTSLSSNIKEILSPLTLKLAVKQDDLLRTIILSWQPAKHITGYKLYQKHETHTNWKLIKTIKSNKTIQFKDFDKKRLKDGQKYEYKISAFDEKIETQASNIVIGKTKNLPSPPDNFEGTSGKVKKVKLSWKASHDRDNKGYLIYRKNNKGNFEEIEDISNINNNHFIDDGEAFTDLKDGTVYEYQIATYNKYSAKGPMSGTISATTKHIPKTVSELSIEKDNSGFLIFWKLPSNTDINQYHVYRGKNKSCSSMRKVGQVDSNSDVYNYTDVQAGTTYCFKVQAIDNDKLQSQLSAPVFYTTEPEKEGN
ncbi:hypothetical protein [Pseudoalteromonas denitrificans]|uniref:Fibronectin type 3 domain-containing protein n=1 Tax=Pseudoalteromonas denitrificans DSM 6059 TaxID=1123010 RepID=A0A1I1FGI4_9GAMM|nr:hypothetical protein [Pseudoalteromonas denitrificans]SFB98485.1 fibronectin type 3 domain-containing protein [Pseudoalteromonas denitrificans DSM 6059]